MRLLSLVPAALACCALAACGGGSSGAGAGKAGPISIGAISSLTGPVQFPEATAAAKAVFDRVNAMGGINGHKINYVVADDGGNPVNAAQAARRLVSQGVVALVGGASLVSCATNANYYAAAGIADIEGTGVNSQCFTSKNIAPVNTGPFTAITALLDYTSSVLHDTRICTILLNAGVGESDLVAAVRRWERISGIKPAFVDTSIGIFDDPTPAVIRVKQAGCQAVVFNSVEPIAVVMLKVAKAQGVLSGVSWLSQTSDYSQPALQAFAKQHTLGLIANSEFLPYSSPNAASWRALMSSAGVPLDSFGEGGYLAANIIVRVLKAIKGPVTASSVLAALRHVTDYMSPLIGTPWSFGTANAHAPEQASQFVQAAANGWKVVYPQWLVLPR